jgi:hypothetical protein
VDLNLDKVILIAGYSHLIYDPYEMSGWESSSGVLVGLELFNQFRYTPFLLGKPPFTRAILNIWRLLVEIIRVYFFSRSSTNTSVEELYKIAKMRTEQGFQLAIHGNGDKSIDNILEVLQRLADEGYDLTSLRPRIEHSSILHDQQINR